MMGDFVVWNREYDCLVEVRYVISLDLKGEKHVARKRLALKLALCPQQLVLACEVSASK